MDYLYKPNWESAKKMFESYWRQENEGRCLLDVKAKKNKNVSRTSLNSRQPLESLEQKWLDADLILGKHQAYFENTYFPAEALPMVNVKLGPGVTAAYLGCPYKLDETTVWFEPIIKDWDKDDFQFDENSFMWKKTLEITKKAAEIGKGKYFVNQTGLSGVIDIIAHLRGTENLLFDLIDCPDKVKKARDRILSVLFDCLNKLYGIIKGTNDGGSLSWLEVWSPGLCHALQADFAAMISPEMFEEFVMPEIYRQCKNMPFSIYHLDGPGNVCHLDHLLSIKELNAVQWQAGSGQPSPVEWMDLLKKIQKSGKSIHTYGTCREVLDMLDYLSPRGLYVQVTDELDSPQDADDFIREVEKKCEGLYKTGVIQ